MKYIIKTKEEMQEVIPKINNGDLLYLDNIECLGNSIYEITDILKKIHRKNFQLSICNEISFNFDKEKDTLDKVILLLDSICNMQKERLSKSIRKAVKEGKGVGRKKLQASNIPSVFFDNIKRFKNKEINKREFSEICGCTRPTLNSWLKITENE